MRCTTPSTLASLLVVPMVAAHALAGECPTLSLEGAAIDLSDNVTFQRRAPAVTYNAADGEYLAVWFDLRNPGNNDVFGQRVTETGALVGGNIAIIEFAAAQVDPAIAYNAVDNEYLVSWRTQQAGFFNDSRGRRLAGDGTLIGNDFFIGEGFELGLLHNPAVNEYFQSGRGSGIRAQRITNTGGLVGGTIFVASAGAPAPNGGVALDTTNNRYLATWRNQSDSNLQGRLVGANGALIGGPILISSLFPESGNAAGVAHDAANDRYLVVFGIFQENRILGQFVDSDGTLVGEAFTIADGLVSRPAPTLAFSPTTGAYVVAFSNAGVVRLIVVTAGGVVCDDVGLDSDTFGIPAITWNAARDDFFVAWTDRRNIGEGEEEIFGQIVSFASCPEDLDGSGAVDFADIVRVLSAWGNAGGPEDLDGSGMVDFGDLIRVLSAWGACP